MADAKISALSETTSIVGSDEYVVNDGGTTKKVQASNMLPVGVVTAAKIATGAVTEGKIGTGAVTGTKIGNNSITNTKIISGAVTEMYAMDHNDDDNGATTGSYVQVKSATFGDAGDMIVAGEVVRVVASFSADNTGDLGRLTIEIEDTSPVQILQKATNAMTSGDNAHIIEVEMAFDWTNEEAIYTMKYFDDNTVSSLIGRIDISGCGNELEATLTIKVEVQSASANSAHSEMFYVEWVRDF